MCFLLEMKPEESAPGNYCLIRQKYVDGPTLEARGALEKSLHTYSTSSAESDDCCSDGCEKENKFSGARRAYIPCFYFFSGPEICASVSYIVAEAARRICESRLSKSHHLVERNSTSKPATAGINLKWAKFPLRLTET